MKSNVLGTILAVLFVIGALGTAMVSLQSYFRVKELTRLSIREREIMTLRNAVQNLAGEAIEYSKTHPAIDPILIAFDVKTSATNAPQTNATATPK